MVKNQAKGIAAYQDAFFLDHLQVVKSRGSCYRGHRFLGKGGNGTAFLVTCIDGHNAGLQFAIKVFHKISDKSRRDAFLREAAQLRSLSHPAIVRVFDEGEYRVDERTYPFVVMEFIPLTLRRLLQARRVDRLQAIKLMLCCLSAMQLVHSKSIIHRDIKPENILIVEGQAKIADFGLAKSLLATESVVDPPDALGGTQWPGMPYNYRSPEMVARANGGNVALTTKSDVFQMGTVLHECLTGYNPQVAPSSITDRIALKTKPIKGYRARDLRALILDMLMNDPQERPSVSDCLERLMDIYFDYCAEVSATTGDYA
ncbi:MAG: serine/threonine-protein kinase [Planctomycetota bacterium]